MPGWGTEPEGTDLHGRRVDSGFWKALLDAGNLARYGTTEDERMNQVNTLSIPGVRDAAYNEQGIYDPAAAERYTSAYNFGRMHKPPESLQPTLHAISSGGRELMHNIPFLRDIFGVGEEREALRRAEEMGMRRGSQGYLGENQMGHNLYENDQPPTGGWGAPMFMPR